MRALSRAAVKDGPGVHTFIYCAGQNTRNQNGGCLRRESLRVPSILIRLGIPHSGSRTNGPFLVIMTTAKSIYTHNAALIRLARTTCSPAHTFLPPPDSSSYLGAIALC